MREAEVSLKLRKCQLFTDRIRYLGGEEAGTAFSKGSKHPKTPGELRSFLGICNEYRWFIQGCRDIAALLSTLLKGDVTKEPPAQDAA